MYMKLLPRGAFGCDAGVSMYARRSSTIRDATWNDPSVQGGKQQQRL